MENNINILAADLYRTLEDVMHSTKNKEVENYIRGMIDGVSMLKNKVLSENRVCEQMAAIKK